MEVKQGTRGVVVNEHGVISTTHTVTFDGGGWSGRSVTVDDVEPDEITRVWAQPCAFGATSVCAASSSTRPGAIGAAATAARTAAEQRSARSRDGAP